MCSAKPTNQLRRSQLRTSGHVLVVVMLLMVMGIIIVTMSLGLVIIATQSYGSALRTSDVRAAAEAAVENAILNVLRNPTFIGTALTVGTIPTTTTVTPGTQTVIISAAQDGNYHQKYRVVLERQSGILKVVTWEQVE